MVRYVVCYGGKCVLLKFVDVCVTVQTVVCSIEINICATVVSVVCSGEISCVLRC